MGLPPDTSRFSQVLDALRLLIAIPAAIEGVGQLSLPRDEVMDTQQQRGAGFSATFEHVDGN